MLHTRTIGEFKVTSLIEYYGPTHVPETMFPDFSRSALEVNRDWLVPNHYIPEMDRFVVGIQIWIVHAGSNIILIDSGVGNHKPRATERMNMLNTLTLDWMAAAGAPREKVTHVVITHMHVDHVGWNTIKEDGRWVPTFPNARYLFPKENYDYCKDLLDRGEGPPLGEGGSFADSVLPIVDAGLAEFIDDQKEVAGCLTVEPLPGHTPGHLGFGLKSKGEAGIFAGDIMHHPIQVAKPEWNSGFCLLPDLARRTRTEFLARVSDTGVLIMPCHFGPPGCGYIKKRVDAYTFEPATWE